LTRHCKEDFTGACLKMYGHALQRMMPVSANPLGTHVRTLGVIGHPIAHSVSPQMHYAAFRDQKMNCHYAAFAVHPADLAQGIAGMRALGILGLNVTIPHKEAVMEYLDEVAPSARQVGAVNTIVNRNGRLIGYNTDGWGFISSLEEYGIRPHGRRAVILGAGGSARAIAVHLALAGASGITVSNRTVERAEELATAVRGVERAVPVAACGAGSEQERRALAEAHLVINCTPLGMVPDVGSSPLPEEAVLPPDCIVYDTVYTPSETRLMAMARQRGLKVIGGLGMLVHQGACAWEYWFGRRGPVAVMMESARQALEAKG
jgi:shikimate dehydrogenase